MIDRGNILTLFRELDENLIAQGLSEPREIIIYGGAALISMDIISRATVDIDVFHPKLDPALELAAKTLAKKYLYDEKWISSTGQAFSPELPSGWKERAHSIYTGKVLIVKTLGRVDLIFTKMLAELGRGEDLEDLKRLKPSVQELQSIRPILKSLEPDKLWAQKVDEIISILNELEDE